MTIFAFTNGNIQATYTKEAYEVFVSRSKNMAYYINEKSEIRSVDLDEVKTYKNRYFAAKYEEIQGIIQDNGLTVTVAPYLSAWGAFTDRVMMRNKL